MYCVDHYAHSSGLHNNVKIYLGNGPEYDCFLYLPCLMLFIALLLTYTLPSTLSFT